VGISSLMSVGPTASLATVPRGGYASGMAGNVALLSIGAGIVQARASRARGAT